jgi:DNA-binding NtrC family response regulator
MGGEKMNQPTRVLLLDLSPAGALASVIKNILESSSLAVCFLKESPEMVNLTHFAGNLSSVASSFVPDLVILTSPLEILSQAEELLQCLERKPQNLTVMALVDNGVSTDVVAVMLASGVIEFIPGQVTAAKILAMIWRTLELSTQKSPCKEASKLKPLVGKCAGFIQGIMRIPLCANCNSSVLICGDTGTGKELCARQIHYLSSRADQPFVPVNCGAIPLNLAENELFGHKGGAFTGAAVSTPGLIQEAEGGTLFLDEIDSLPSLAQVKLLRFLQDKTYRPLGSTKERQADVRILAATGTDVEKAVLDGNFRKDLYYRLNVISIKLLPLHKRREDIPLLAGYFLGKYAADLNKHIEDFSEGAFRRLCSYSWPGNVRELEHVVQRAVVLSKGKTIREAEIDLPELEPAMDHSSFKEAKQRLVEHFERNYIDKLLMAYHGNISQAARAARKPRRAFWELIRKHNINVQKFKNKA